MTWLRSEADAVVLSLHIQPGAKKTEVVGLHGTALKIRLAAPPVDGKANAGLINFLAPRLEVAKRQVEIISGTNSRTKQVRVAGVDAESVRSKLLALG
ncbi:MAG: YggU family protein [Betaproteobacteria bacterium]|nr:YggU family protein [Betaproteobacteria bacterium]